MFQTRNLYGVIGTMLFLIAMYLVLNNGTSSVSIINAGNGFVSNVARTLQGR